MTLTSSPLEGVSSSSGIDFFALHGFFRWLGHIPLASMTLVSPQSHAPPAPDLNERLQKSDRPKIIKSTAYAVGRDLDLNMLKSWSSWFPSSKHCAQSDMQELNAQVRHR